jgi:hypothetical protein
MADATFISEALVSEELSSLTTQRLPWAASEVRRARACRRVVSLIKGSAYEVPNEADAPNEWKGLAVEWLAAKLYMQFPEYFRAKMETLEEVETRIARTARIEPLENKTHARSEGGGGDFDYPVCGGGIYP